MPNTLSPSYLEHVAIGREALRTLNIGPRQIADGLTRCGFLFAQMEAAATLPIATRVASLHSLPPSARMKQKGLTCAAQWRSRMASVKGFCHLHLFAFEWVVPALCTLSTYPEASEVACLEAYYRSDFTNWGIYSQGSRCRFMVVHVRSSSRSLILRVSDRLCSFSGSLVGASHPNTPHNGGPPLPIPPAHLRAPLSLLSCTPLVLTHASPAMVSLTQLETATGALPLEPPPTNLTPLTSQPGDEAPPVPLPALIRQLLMML